MAEILFFIFFGALAGVSLVSINARLFDRLIGILFIIFSMPLILFATFRPVGLMRDDGFYQNIINEIPFYEFPERFFNLRDPLWYGLAYLLTKISESVEILFYLSGMILFLKLLILYKIGGKNRLLILFLYACAYWQLHDLTQLRLSASALMFMGFFYFIKTNSKKLEKASIFVSMFFHAQALVNIVFLTKFKIIRKISVVSIVPLFLLLIGFDLIVDLNALARAGEFFLGNRQITRDLDHVFNSYQIMTLDGLYRDTLRLPLILLASSSVYTLVLYSIDVAKYGHCFVKNSALSVVLAIILSWLFASISDIQVRFYEYYFLGGIFLIFETKSRLALLAVYILAVLYFFKFNIFWNIWDVAILNSIFK